MPKPVIVGPNGEKRSMSPVANAHHVIQVALGIKEEEYVDTPKPKRRRRNPVSNVEMAYSVGSPKKSKKKPNKRV